MVFFVVSLCGLHNIFALAAGKKREEGEKKVRELEVLSFFFEREGERKKDRTREKEKVASLLPILTFFNKKTTAEKKLRIRFFLSSRARACSFLPLLLLAVERAGSSFRRWCRC